MLIGILVLSSSSSLILPHPSSFCLLLLSRSSSVAFLPPPRSFLIIHPLFLLPSLFPFIPPSLHPTLLHPPLVPPTYLPPPLLHLLSCLPRCTCCLGLPSFVLPFAPAVLAASFGTCGPSPFPFCTCCPGPPSWEPVSSSKRMLGSRCPPRKECLEAGCPVGKNAGKPFFPRK